MFDYFNEKCIIGFVLVESVGSEKNMNHICFLVDAVSFIL